MTCTLTTKAQITVPEAMRDHLRVAPGDAVDFRIVADATVGVEPAQTPHPSDTERLEAARARFGRLRGSGCHSSPASTDALMGLLRGYDDDSADLGFADSVPPVRPPKRAKRDGTPRRP